MGLPYRAGLPWPAGSERSRRERSRRQARGASIEEEIDVTGHFYDDDPQKGHADVRTRLKTGRRGASVERLLTLHPDNEARTWLVYSLEAGARAVHEATMGHDPLEEDARQCWTRATHGSFGNTLLDRAFNASRWQLPAVVSRQGRVDAGIWQYARERVRDQAFMALGLVMAGHRDQAAVIFWRLLREFVTADGVTVDSSEVRGRDEVELDQNGVLLYALLQYVCWTGDRDLIASSWDSIAAVAEFPLRPEFRHEPSGLLHNAREFWERHRIHGIEPGLELAHQLFVSLGLSSAASLARLLSHGPEAARWRGEARLLRQAMLAHPVYALVDHRGFIKRRRLDGPVQEVTVPLPGVPLAQPGEHRLNPDASTVLPIAFGFVDGRSSLSTGTLVGVERLWNQAWTGGGSVPECRVDGRPVAPSGGAWLIGHPADDISVEMTAPHS